MEVLNVKVGDKVLVSKGSRYKNNDFIAEVEKVTSTGRIRLTPTGRTRLSDRDSTQFDKYGREMGITSYYPYRLSIPTKEDYKRVERNKLVGKILYNIRSFNTDNLYNLDTDMLKVLNIALDCIGVTDEKIKEDKLNQIWDILSASEEGLQDKETVETDIER